MLKRKENYIKKRVEKELILYLFFKVNFSRVLNMRFFLVKSKFVFDVIFSFFVCEKWKGWVFIFI